VLLASDFSRIWLAVIGVPILILSLTLLFAGLCWSIYSWNRTVARRLAVASIALAILEYLLLCPWLSAGSLFEVDSSADEYPELLMAGFVICLGISTLTVWSFVSKRKVP
jgi:hypothetical protein